jgi:hypothetical protein
LFHTTHFFILYNSGQREKLSEGDKNALNKLYPPKKTFRSQKQALEREWRNLTVDNESVLILKERIERREEKLINLSQRSSPRP